MGDVRDRWERPDSAVFVPVPKRGLPVARAALLTVSDRIASDALVTCRRPRIEK
jgi:hypothetical protein